MQRVTDARQGSGGAGGAATTPHAAARPVAPNTAIERALATMRGPLDRPLPLATLAESAGLSPFHFARTFRQATGIPPGQFLTALRLEQAKGLLLTTDRSVTEICFAVGYDSVGTFTTRFTQLVGLSPGRIRALPERLGEALARLPEGGLAAPAAAPTDAASGVVGRIEGHVGADTLLFIGLFPGAIPQGRPVVGTVLTAPGPFRLARPRTVAITCSSPPCRTPGTRATRRRCCSPVRRCGSGGHRGQSQYAVAMLPCPPQSPSARPCRPIRRSWSPSPPCCSPSARNCVARAAHD